MKRLILGISLSLGLFAPSLGWGEGGADIEALARSVRELQGVVQKLQSAVASQQREIAALEQENISLKSGTTDKNSEIKASSPPSNPKKGGGYLPDVGIVVDIVGQSTKSPEDEEGNDRISARDVELVLGHDVDPYLRLDATIVFSDVEEPSVEEAYASFWDLPLDSKARFGRLKPKIGKAASLHRDSLDTMDVPLVVQRYLGAEGLSRSGVDIGAFTPLSGGSFTQELTLGVLEGGGGEGGQLLGETRRIPSFYGRLRNSLDISELTSGDLGVSWLNGSADSDGAREATAVGVDATLSHFVTPRNKLKVQGELFLTDRKNDGTEGYLNESAKGYYALVDYRLAERWGVGARWDSVEPILADALPIEDQERVLTGYLTFFQSEFARWRVQYQHAWLLDDTDDNRVFLQGTFAIGTHKHSIQ